MLRQFIPYTKIYLLAFLLLAIGISTGKFLMSISSIMLASAWVLEGDYKAKWKQIKTNYYTPLILAIVFLIHIIWLLNTSNIDYAMHDIVLKLPLLSFPIVLGSIPPLSKKKYLLIIGVFIAGLLVSTLISYGIYLEILPTERDISDVRNISIFISHIRLSLLICLAIVLSFYYFFKNSLATKIITLLLSSWFTYFLFILSGTGVIVLSLLALFSLIWISCIQKNLLLKRVAAIGTLVFLTFTLGYVSFSYKDYSEIKDSANFEALDLKTANGELYIHDTTSRVTENGYYLWLYVAPLEVQEAWEKRSNIPFDSLGNNKQPIAATLYRYITSKGDRKDREGVLKLTGAEIIDIENGKTSIVNYSGVNKRLREIFFEFENKEGGFSANGHSITQRIYFASVGVLIVKENLFFGVGTGDVPDEFNQKYKEIHSELSPENRKRAHNQFLTFLISFGCIGFIIWFISFIYPMFKLTKDVFIYSSFLLILVVSFIGDDTLETQAGVTFYAFFNSLFLFHSFEKNGLKTRT